MPKPRSKSSAAIKPIRLAILWHQHQPWYRIGERAILPWAWLHATKDYLEMAQHLERHPEMRATINLVPSLLEQIDDYLHGRVTDPMLVLFAKSADALTAADKRELLARCFQVNYEHVIKQSPRFHELQQRSEDSDKALATFVEQDWRDLAILYQLGWTGTIAKMTQEPFKSLSAKGRGYSEEDRMQLEIGLRDLVGQIVPLHKKLQEQGVIEITTTPYFHPILPLLCDTDSARDAMPYATLPHNRFQAPTEAAKQLKNAATYMKSQFGQVPAGLWPSEGSISEAAVTEIRAAGFAWCASDEGVLQRSTPAAKSDDIASDHAKYFPWSYKTPSGPITIFFRDHDLSDSIGFTYQSWSAADAANDFAQRIRNIRVELVKKYGEVVLDRAVVSVILDGENCWEYYPNNGFDFLDALYTLLEEDAEIMPVTFSQAISGTAVTRIPKLAKVTAGSWIHSNFGIWIGHAEDNAAWDALYLAKNAIETARKRLRGLSGQTRIAFLARLAQAERELMIAEGSDWCWWYGDEHSSNDRATFDELYRTHLRAVYALLDLSVPTNLLKSIIGTVAHDVLASERVPSGMPTTPTLTGALSDPTWASATKIFHPEQFGSMHKASSLEPHAIDTALVHDVVYLRLELVEPLAVGNRINIVFHDSSGLVLRLASSSVTVQSSLEAMKKHLAVTVAVGATIDLAIPAELLDRKDGISFALELLSGTSKKIRERFPTTGWIEHEWK